MCMPLLKHDVYGLYGIGHMIGHSHSKIFCTHFDKLITRVDDRCHVWQTYNFSSLMLKITKFLGVFFL